MNKKRELKRIEDDRAANLDRFATYSDIIQIALDKSDECIKNGERVKAETYTEIACFLIQKRQECIDELNDIIKRLEGLV